MKRKRLSGIFFYPGLLAIYMASLGVMFVFFDNIAVRNSVISRYQAERTAFALIESFRQDQLPANLETAELVRGFGIYRLDGTSIYTWKNAPDFLDPRALNRNNLLAAVIDPDAGFVFDKKRKSIKLTRPVINMQMRGMGMRRMMHIDAEAPAYLYMEQEIPGYWKSYHLLSAAQWSVPVFLLLVLGIIACLYKKNRDYKVRLAANTELIRLGEISRALAHEIKNPLSAIRLQTGLLKKTLPGTHREELKIIEEEVMRLGILTGRISDFLRDPVGTPEKIHLEAFVLDLIKRFDFDIRFTHYPYNETIILFDKDRLRSVLENIIRNGIESYGNLVTTGAAYLEIEILNNSGTNNSGTNNHGANNDGVNYGGANDTPALLIRDQGSGITPEITAKVFEAGYTSKAAGSGIGLAIARRFVEAGRGSLSIVSRKEGGTEVKISFRRG